MNGPDHYHEAEKILEEVKADPTDRKGNNAWRMGMAQAHATLALAAATALNFDSRRRAETAGTKIPEGASSPDLHEDSGPVPLAPGPVMPKFDLDQHDLCPRSAPEDAFASLPGFAELPSSPACQACPDVPGDRGRAGGGRGRSIGG